MPRVLFVGSGAIVCLSLLFCGCGFQDVQITPTPVPNRFVFAANSAATAISVYKADITTGALAPVPGSPFSASGGPLVIAATPSGRFLFASSGDHTVSAYAINAATGALTPIGALLPGPWRPSDIAVHPSEKFVYVSDRFAGDPGSITSGSVWAYAVDTTGALTAVPGSPFLVNFYAQSVTIEPSGRYLYVADNGIPAIQGFAIDTSTGALTPLADSPYPVPSTVNPIAAAMDPQGRFLFVIDAAHNLPTDPSNVILVYAIHTDTGTLVPVAGSPFSAGSNEALADVAVDSLGKYLYVSNAAGIASFVVDGSGALATSIPFGTVQSTPQVNMVVDSSGKFMYVGCPWASFISVYTIDTATGVLKPLAGTPYPTSTANDWLTPVTAH